MVADRCYSYFTRMGFAASAVDKMRKQAKPLKLRDSDRPEKAIQNV